MKTFLWMATAGMLALASCQSKPGYTINGTIAGAADGDTVYLQNVVNGKLVKIDSAVVKGGTFQFTGDVDTVTVSRYVTYTDTEAPKHINAMVFLEPGTITLELGGEAPKVAGTVCNDAYQNFMTEFIAANKEMRDLYNQTRNDSLSEEQRKEAEKQLEEKDSLSMEMVFNTISSNITNLVGVQLLTSYSGAFDAERIQPLVDQIPASFANDEGVVRMKEHLAALAKTAVGQKFIDFTMNTPEGESVKLSDFIAKNKYTLIDFWASWCGPCRAEMPNVVKAYKKYQAKGFGIVGVSLDRDAEAWKKAIKDLNITWPQMSDLKAWDCEGAKLYAVRAIPATVLVDQEGTIIARDLRGDDIATKLAELLK